MSALQLPASLGHLDLVEDAPTLWETASALFCASGCHRYALTRVWDGSRSVVVWIMLNPSTADAFSLDPTLSRCRVRSGSWMSGGMVVANAYALRSTDPGVLRGHPDPVGVDNDAVIRWVLGPDFPHLVARVVVGWGANSTLIRQGRGREVLDLIGELGHRPVCLKVTKGGHPQHPLYVGYDQDTSPYVSCPER